MGQIYALLLAYKYFLLLPLVMVGGPIVTIIGAFMASLGVLDVYMVYAVALFGNVLGDTMYYSIGRFGGYKFIPKYGHYLGLTESRTKYAEEHYKNHLGKTLFFGKLTEVAIIPILVATGISKVKFGRFFGTIVSIEIPKVLMFTLIGFYFGKYYVLIEKYLHAWATVGLIVVIVVASVYWFFIRKK